ncbi:MAG: hypothetical protein ING29_08585 [Azospirillum sp.]|nr:hypothetical protein [Azospirillum sp.]
MTDEEMCRFLRHTAVGVGHYEEAAARLEALRAERDAAKARAEKAEAENARLREAMREEYRASHEVCNQADETRMAYGEIQMVEVPKWSIEWLKQAATVLDDALAPAEAKEKDNG